MKRETKRLLRALREPVIVAARDVAGALVLGSAVVTWLLVFSLI